MSAETYLDALENSTPPTQPHPSVDERLERMAQQLDWLCNQFYGMQQQASAFLSGGGGLKGLMALRKAGHDGED